MSDEGFHEIQLNGKQLVFLFMAATVVSVVIFLCGVMVGRGVRGQMPTASASDFGPTGPDASAADSGATATPQPLPASAPPASEAAPPDPAEGGYHGALTADKPADEKLAPAPAPREERAAAERPTEKPTEKTAEKAKPSEPTPPPPARAAAAAPPASVTSGDGFVVQVAALRDRSEADALVRRLAGKGYSAFVVNPVPGKPPVYKVQVGRFTDRGEATRISARLKSEEQFSPWVTR
jgi:cell division protein FtsN